MKIRKEGTKSEQGPDWALDWRRLYGKLYLGKRRGEAFRG
jgi:hypothetical protein